MHDMNRNTTYALFGVTFAIVAGMVGTNLPLTQSLGLAEKQATSDSAVIPMMGHVTYVLKDASGDIKSYRQTDNVVVNSGKNCVSKLIFGGGTSTRSFTGTGVCIGANNAPWNVISIGNLTTNTQQTVNQIDYKLSQENNATAGFAIGNNFNARTVGTVSWTSGNQTGASGSSSPTISATFGPISGIRSGGLYVVSSGLFNSTTQTVASQNAGGMFAQQAITPIQVNNGDSLTIKWTVNVG